MAQLEIKNESHRGSNSYLTRGYTVRVLGSQVTLSLEVVIKLVRGLFLLPPDTLKLLPDEMQSTLGYYKRLSRCDHPTVESSCGPVNEAKLVSPADTEKRYYIGTGQDIYEVHVWHTPWDSDKVMREYRKVR